jgi:hypothetical protein
MKVYTAQLLRGAFDALMTTIRQEAAAGLHICTLSTASFTHFFRLATWFMQYCRYQEERRVSKRPTCVPKSHVECSVSAPLLLSCIDIPSGASALYVLHLSAYQKHTCGGHATVRSVRMQEGRRAGSNRAVADAVPEHVEHSVLGHGQHRAARLAPGHRHGRSPEGGRGLGPAGGLDQGAPVRTACHVRCAIVPAAKTHSGWQDVCVTARRGC